MLINSSIKKMDDRYELATLRDRAIILKQANETLEEK